MSRMLVNVSTDHWVNGQRRLVESLERLHEPRPRIWSNILPPGCPKHADVPYAFKAYALKAATEEGSTTLLWCDASVVPIRPLGPLWEHIEREGYWICRNGWWNSEWTADAAYPDLFPGVPIEQAKLVNGRIPHVIATAFGIDIRHDAGLALLAQYYLLASETRAFCGPWRNTNASDEPGRNVDRRAWACGPATTLGHRHDQTALSVIAHNLGMQLTDPPEFFTYAGGETDATVLLAVGI